MNAIAREEPPRALRARLPPWRLGGRTFIPYDRDKTSTPEIIEPAVHRAAERGLTSVGLNTAQKIALATAASRVVLAGRRLLGRPPTDEFVRRGIRWQLDLREGIDFCIYLLGAFEPLTVRAYSAIVRPGQTVLDIGANIGAHTLPLARLVGPAGRVVAFEPTEFAYRKCAANIALNPGLAPHISLQQVMLLDRKASVPPAIYSSWPLVEEQGLHEKHGGQLKGTQGARSATLDELADELELPAEPFIKLDIDGYEFPVLAGGARMLRALRPTIALELATYVHAEQGHALEDLVALLVGSGYRLKTIDGSRTLPVEPAALRRLIPEGGSINALAVPV